MEHINNDFEFKIYPFPAKEKTFTVVVNDLLYDHFGTTMAIQICNSIVSNIFESCEGDQGTETSMDIVLLNKPVVEPDNKTMNADKLLNKERPWIRVLLKQNQNIINADNGTFKKLDLEFIFKIENKEMGKIRYQIGPSNYSL